MRTKERINKTIADTTENAVGFNFNTGAIIWPTTAPAIMHKTGNTYNRKEIFSSEIESKLIFTRSPSRAPAGFSASTSIFWPPSVISQASLDAQVSQALERVVLTHALPDPIFVTIPSSVAKILSLNGDITVACRVSDPGY